MTFIVSSHSYTKKRATYIETSNMTSEIHVIVHSITVILTKLWYSGLLWSLSPLKSLFQFTIPASTSQTANRLELTHRRNPLWSVYGATYVSQNLKPITGGTISTLEHLQVIHLASHTSSQIAVIARHTFPPYRLATVSESERRRSVSNNFEVCFTHLVSLWYIFQVHYDVHHVWFILASLIWLETVKYRMVDSLHTELQEAYVFSSRVWEIFMKQFAHGRR